MNMNEMIASLKDLTSVKSNLTREDKYCFAVKQKAEHWNHEMEKNLKTFYHFNERGRFNTFVNKGLAGRYFLNSLILKEISANEIDKFLEDVLIEFDKIQEKNEGFKFSITPSSSIYSITLADKEEYCVDVVCKLNLAPENQVPFKKVVAKKITNVNKKATTKKLTTVKKNTVKKKINKK